MKAALWWPSNMSYLLKALQKAEEERQQQNTEIKASNQVINVQSKLPMSMIVIMLMILALTIWQVWPKTQGNQKDDEAPELVQANITATGKQTKAPQIEQPIIVAKSELKSTPEIKDLTQLSASELARIPSLELASHIYSSAPQFRSVVINGQTYQEGQLIKQGVILKEINQSGIVINVQNQFISLPKGISWIASQDVK